MNIIKYKLIKYTIIFLLPLCYQSLLADEQIKNSNTYLNVTRTQLNIAYDNYNKGAISTSKRNLKNASEWLHRGVQHSKSEIVKTEAKKLAEDIDSFRLTLNKSSEKNDMARFWHKASSLIQRESEHLIHSYTESSTNNKIMKYLLDAKMHFYTAEHDIFFSHNSVDATIELKNSLEYLEQAESLVKDKTNPYITHLISSINELISISESSKNAWKQDTLIHSLESAIKNLNEAESVASPPMRLRLELINQTTSKLKKDILKRSLKEKYESIMVDFRRVINNV